MLAEQDDEWAESRRYMGLDVLSKSRLNTTAPAEQRASRTGGHPCSTDRINHDNEESHDDVVHHVPGLDCEIKRCLKRAIAREVYRIMQTEAASITTVEQAA